MDTKITRIYYRNTFFHAGHIKTLLDNERIAKASNGICYAIIDDRYDSRNFQSLLDEIEYLELRHIKIISVKNYYSAIIDYTKKLIQEEKIYICRYDTEEYDPNAILRIINRMSDRANLHFQMRLKNGATIGYTSRTDQGLTITLIFDYIIKVLDQLLQVTDIINTTASDMRDIKDENISKFFSDRAVRYHHLDTYRIENFKYIKKGWNTDNESNPYLLTFKGMRARHIPAIILKAFYIHASQIGHVNIRFIGQLLDYYLNEHCTPVMGVIKPVRVTVTDWEKKRTEYVVADHNILRPMTSVFYVDQSDIGMDRRINVDQEFHIYPNMSFRCTEITDGREGGIGDRDRVEVKAVITEDKYQRRKTIYNWVSSKWDNSPCKVRFYLYGWFYTGYNELLEPDVSDGYIDQNVFDDLDKIYYIRGYGYFIYDRGLSADGVPTFMRIAPGGGS